MELKRWLEDCCKAQVEGFAAGFNAWGDEVFFLSFNVSRTSMSFGFRSLAPGMH